MAAAQAMLGHDSGKASQVDGAPLPQPLPNIRERPIVILAEVQLHLKHYLDQRRKAHLWFKILRSVDPESLALDCYPYYWN